MNVNTALLTTHEAHVLFDLAEAWNKYLLLPDHPPDDIDDFRKAVHDAQRIVLARVGRRQLQGIEGADGPIIPTISLEDLKELAEQMKSLAYSKKSPKSPAEPI